MNYMTIREHDIANGPGIRVTLFVSGCRLNCKNCFNKEAQSFSAGNKFTKETIDYILKVLDQEHINGLSILGGDSLEKENQGPTLDLIKAFRAKFGNSKDIWVWTGRTWNQLQENGKYRTEFTEDFLKNIDVLIDGPYIESLNKRGLIYMGSTNQKIIDSKKSIEQGKLILAKEDSIERR